MAEHLDFDSVYTYSFYKTGISVEAELRSGETSVDLEAKIDTGSTYCVFERYYGESLGLESESGIRVEIGTATGIFCAYGHELVLTVFGIELISTVYFAEDAGFDRNVLGRIGWLDRVKMGLIDAEGKLFLSEYKASG